MRRLVIIASVLMCVVPVVAQVQRPFTFQDMMSLKRVAEPVPSPDGKWVLFSPPGLRTCARRASVKMRGLADISCRTSALRSCACRLAPLVLKMSSS